MLPADLILPVPEVESPEEIERKIQRKKLLSSTHAQRAKKKLIVQHEDITITLDKPVEDDDGILHVYVKQIEKTGEILPLAETHYVFVNPPLRVVGSDGISYEDVDAAFAIILSQAILKHGLK